MFELKKPQLTSEGRVWVAYLVHGRDILIPKGFIPRGLLHQILCLISEYVINISFSNQQGQRQVLVEQLKLVLLAAAAHSQLKHYNSIVDELSDEF